MDKEMNKEVSQDKVAGADKEQPNGANSPMSTVSQSPALSGLRDTMDVRNENDADKKILSEIVEERAAAKSSVQVSEVELSGLTADIDDIVVDEIVRAEEQDAVGRLMQETARQEQVKRKEGEKEKQLLNEISKDRVKATATAVTDDPSWQTMIEQLSSMDEVSAIKMLARSKAEAMAMFEKNFREVEFDRLVQERLSQKEAELKRRGRTLEDYLDELGLTVEQYRQQLETQVYYNERIEMQTKVLSEIEANARLAELQAAQLRVVRERQKQEEMRKKQSVEETKKSFEAYIRGQLREEVMSKGVPFEVYKAAYNEVKSGINPMSAKAKEVVRIAVIERVKELMSNKSTGLAPAVNASVPVEEKKPVPTGIIDRRPKLYY